MMFRKRDIHTQLMKYAEIYTNTTIEYSYTTTSKVSSIKWACGVIFNMINRLDLTNTQLDIIKNDFIDNNFYQKWLERNENIKQYKETVILPEHHKIEKELRNQIKLLESDNNLTNEQTLYMYKYLLPILQNQISIISEELQESNRVDKT